MRSLKFYKLVIVVLVVLNISTLAYYTLTKPPHPPKPGDHQISLRLELDGEAKSKVDVLEKQHHKQKRALMHKDNRLHKKLFQLIGTDKSPDEILGQIANNRNRMELMTYEFFNEIAEHCNEKQKKELLQFVDMRLNKMRPGPPPPRR